MQQVGVWAGAIISVITIVGLILSVGMRLGQALNELEALRDDVDALSNYLRGEMAGPPVPGG